RVRCCEWVRRLSLLPNTDFENAKLRNDYVQLLRIIVRSGVLHGIFLDTPPSGNLKPLSEAVGSNIIKNIPHMSPVGPIAPFICHKSPDGRAYISIKRVPGNGILCYMAASPDGVDGMN
ncbi:hypothetical protein GE061_005150, partial [Apolygus lucorum]